MTFITLKNLESFTEELVNKIFAIFVRAESGRGLSSNDYTTEEKTWLNELKNTMVDSAVQSDWNVNDPSSNAYIKNKPEVTEAKNADIDSIIDGSLNNGERIVTL